MKFLALDLSGNPRKWISPKKAIIYHVNNEVVYEIGEKTFVFRGGHNKDGIQSVVETKSIIAVKGKIFSREKSVPLSNKMIFARDRYTCAYCLRKLPYEHLSKDHIIPTYQKGDNSYMNLITSCKTCNISKGKMTPEQWGVKLSIQPYVPSYAEYLAVNNPKMDEDQRNLLKQLAPKHTRVF